LFFILWCLYLCLYIILLWSSRRPRDIILHWHTTSYTSFPESDRAEAWVCISYVFGLVGGPWADFYRGFRGSLFLLFDRLSVMLLSCYCTSTFGLVVLIELTLDCHEEQHLFVLMELPLCGHPFHSYRTGFAASTRGPGLQLLVLEYLVCGPL
jgi:hypothetical protein